MHSLLGIHEAPNVYNNDQSDLDGEMSVQEKCEAVATKAVTALFPEAQTRGFESFGVYDYRMENYFDDLNRSLDSARDKSDERQKELKGRKEELESWFRQIRFKEYYTICLGVEEPATEKDIEYEDVIHEMLVDQFGKEEADRVHNARPQTVINNWLIAVDLNFEEVSIMRNASERTQFGLSLGSEHKRVYDAKIAFAYECLE